MSWKAGPVHPCNPATARSESTKLSVDPTGETLVYVNGRSVVLRPLATPALATVYSQHTQPTTVARISPSGYYAASADVAGNVRVWDVKGGACVLKLAARPKSGRLNHPAWDGESKRLVVGGEGRDKFGAAFFIDSGSSCGEVSGHAKPITALAVRHQRPFRAVSGSDDNSLVFHTAVPFKYDKLIATHTRFVRDVAYAPSGDVFASVGSDAKVFWYDGKTADVRAQSGDGASSLMACSWSPDSSTLATAGADGVVTLWDAATQQSGQSWTVGSDVQSQQNGVTYAGPHTIVSVSLSGVLNIFDARDANVRQLHGPTKAVTAAALTSAAEPTFYTGSFDGGVKAFSGDGHCDDVAGGGHAGQVAAVATLGDKAWTAGWDDKVVPIENKQFGAAVLPTKAQPTGLAAGSQATYVATTAGLEVHPAAGSSKVAVEGAVGAVAAAGDAVAYGVGKKVVLAKGDGAGLRTEAEFDESKGDVIALAFSPDGKYLAAGDTAGRIILVDAKDKNTLVSSRWTFHTGRVTSLAFSADSKRLASSGTDESIYIWDPAKVAVVRSIKNAHPGGVVGVAWRGGNAIVSAGADGCVRNWKEE